MNRRTITYLVCGVLALMVLASGQGLLAQASNGPAPVKMVNTDIAKPLAVPPAKMMTAKVDLEIGTTKAIPLGTYTWGEMAKKFGITAGNVQVSKSWNPSSDHPAMAIDSGGYYVTFSYLNGSKHDMGFAKSTDGNTWAVRFRSPSARSTRSFRLTELRKGR